MRHYVDNGRKLIPTTTSTPSTPPLHKQQQHQHQQQQTQVELAADVPNLSATLRVKEIMQYSPLATSFTETDTPRYDPALEQRVWDWMCQVLGGDIGPRDQPLTSHLKSGTVSV